MKTLEEVFAAELNRFDPSLTTTEIAAHVAAAVAIGSHRLDADGRLVPGSREAVNQASFLPRAFVHGVSKEAAASGPTAAERTIRFLNGIGHTLDSAIGVDTGMGPDVAAAVQQELQALAVDDVDTRVARALAPREAVGAPATAANLAQQVRDGIASQAVDSLETRWARTAERLGAPGVKLGDLL